VKSSIVMTKSECYSTPQYFVWLGVCLSVTSRYCGKTAEWTELLFDTEATDGLCANVEPRQRFYSTGLSHIYLKGSGYLQAHRYFIHTYILI